MPQIDLGTIILIAVLILLNIGFSKTIKNIFKNSHPKELRKLFNDLELHSHIKHTPTQKDLKKIIITHIKKQQRLSSLGINKNTLEKTAQILLFWFLITFTGLVLYSQKESLQELKFLSKLLEKTSNYFETIGIIPLWAFVLLSIIFYGLVRERAQRFSDHKEFFQKGYSISLNEKEVELATELLRNDSIQYKEALKKFTEKITLFMLLTKLYQKEKNTLVRRFPLEVLVTMNKK